LIVSHECVRKRFGHHFSGGELFLPGCVEHASDELVQSEACLLDFDLQAS